MISGNKTSHQEKFNLIQKQESHLKGAEDETVQLTSFYSQKSVRTSTPVGKTVIPRPPPQVPILAQPPSQIPLTPLPFQPGPIAEAEATTIPYRVSTPKVPPRPVIPKQLLTPQAFTLSTPVPSTIPKINLVPPPPQVPIPAQPKSQIPLIPLPPQPAPAISQSGIGSTVTAAVTSVPTTSVQTTVAVPTTAVQIALPIPTTTVQTALSVPTTTSTVTTPGQFTYIFNTSSTLKIEKFKGDNTQNAETWLDTFRQYCSFYDMSKQKSAESLPFHLDGHAKIWLRYSTAI